MDWEDEWSFLRKPKKETAPGREAASPERVQPKTAVYVNSGADSRVFHLCPEDTFELVYDAYKDAASGPFELRYRGLTLSKYAKVKSVAPDLGSPINIVVHMPSSSSPSYKVRYDKIHTVHVSRGDLHTIADLLHASIEEVRARVPGPSPSYSCLLFDGDALSPSLDIEAVLEDGDLVDLV